MNFSERTCMVIEEFGKEEESLEWRLSESVSPTYKDGYLPEYCALLDTYKIISLKHFIILS
jgi:hypothetical protein